MVHFPQPPSEKLLERNGIYFFTIASILLAAGMITSFIQYYQNSIDGDIVPIVLPMSSYSEIFHDPFGLKAVFHGDQYSGAGRWMIHVTLYTLFHQCYFFVTHFTSDNINALFLTSALFQWLCDWLMVSVIAMYALLAQKITLKKFLFACVLVVPFFQFNHWYPNMGIIDHSVTYTAFYAFPISLLMFFFYPFFRAILFNRSLQFSPVAFGSLSVLGFLLAFSGPLIPALGIMIGGVLLCIFYLNVVKRNKDLSIKSIIANIRKIPFAVRSLIIPFIILCAYDFYVGRFNIENNVSVSIAQRYQLMFKGASDYFFQYGLPYCYGLILLNFIFFRVYQASYLGTRGFRILSAFAITILAYLLLLPLGGYRPYRPNILRYDVTMPLTIFFIVTIVSGISILLNSLRGKQKLLYSFITITTLAVLWYQNFPISNDRKEQEIMLRMLASSHSDSTVVLPYSSNFFHWGKIDNPEGSYNIKFMLQDWKITDRAVTFYQK